MIQGQETHFPMSNNILLWMILIMLAGALITGIFVIRHFNNTLNAVLKTTQLNEIKGVSNEQKLFRYGEEIKDHEQRLRSLERKVNPGN